MAGPGRAARGSAAHSMPAVLRPDCRGDAAELSAPLRATGARGQGGGGGVRGKGRRAHAQCGAGAGGGREAMRAVTPCGGPHPARAAQAPRPPGPPGRGGAGPVRCGAVRSVPFPLSGLGGQADLRGGTAAQVGARGYSRFCLCPSLHLRCALLSHSRSDSGERELVNTLTPGHGRTVLLVAGAAQSTASGLSSWAAVVKSAATRGFCSLTHLGLLCMQPLAFLKVLHWME